MRVVNTHANTHAHTHTHTHSDTHTHDHTGRFVVADGDYSAELALPDKMVEWDVIREVGAAGARHIDGPSRPRVFFSHQSCSLSKEYTRRFVLV